MTLSAFPAKFAARCAPAPAPDLLAQADSALTAILTGILRAGADIAAAARQGLQDRRLCEGSRGAEARREHVKDTLAEALGGGALGGSGACEVTSSSLVVASSGKVDWADLCVMNVFATPFASRASPTGLALGLHWFVFRDYSALSLPIRAPAKPHLEMCPLEGVRIELRFVTRPNAASHRDHTLVFAASCSADTLAASVAPPAVSLTPEQHACFIATRAHLTALYPDRSVRFKYSHN